MSKDDDGPKLGTNTTFRLTPEMTAELDALKERDGCTKDAIIRRLLQYGLKVEAELQKLADTAAGRVALHEVKEGRVKLNTVSSRERIKGGHSR